MSGLENMATRLSFNGGNAQIKRMNNDKLKALKKALLYSYQSATAKLADGREFRCLINPDHLKNTYDDKILSIPFEDVCLNAEKMGKTNEGLVQIGMKPGDVFTWKENGTDWLVFLQRLEETAYFRAEIRRCKYTVEIDGKEYKCYAARPSTNEIDWRTERDMNWNDIDYTLQMYITKDASTEAFFHRFMVVKVNGKPWEVQAIDNMSSDGIIIIALKEWYQNTIAETAAQETTPETISAIVGPSAVYPYETITYTIDSDLSGFWEVSNTKAKILKQTNSTAIVNIVTGKSGKFNLIYKQENKEDIVLKVTINSL